MRQSWETMTSVSASHMWERADEGQETKNGETMSEREGIKN